MSKIEIHKVFLTLILSVASLFLLCQFSSCSLPHHVTVQQAHEEMLADSGYQEYAPVTKCINNEMYEIDQRDGASMPKVYLVGACYE